MKNSPLWLLLSLAISACGSSPPPKAASADSANGNDSASTSAGTSADEQREPFMKSCVKSDAMKDYCECGFGQFVEIFRGVDLSKDVAKDDPRFEKVASQTKLKCGDKFPEPEAKKQFVGSCTSGESKKEPYCSCSWAELRKSLSVLEIISVDPEDPKWVEAKKLLPKGCKGKFPAEIAQNEFVEACKKEGATEPRCECLWKKVSAAFTIEEIVADTREVSEVPGLDKCK